jgi:anti-sigma factor ChrR (cupin superfamily)
MRPRRKPGIRRRLLWQAGNACADLARAQLGAAVPAHSHRNDEECFMIEGELFTGDILVREGELQLAPVGLKHGHVRRRRPAWCICAVMPSWTSCPADRAAGCVCAARAPVNSCRMAA